MTVIATVEKDLAAAASAIGTFVKKEVAGVESLLEKGQSVLSKIEADLPAIKAEAIVLYNDYKAGKTLAAEVVQAIITLIADLSAAGI